MALVCRFVEFHQLKTALMNVVITGASRGLGKAMAGKFASAGYHLYLGARNEELLSATAKELKALQQDIVVETKTADFSQRSGVDAFAQWILDKKIKIDILVNNAGTFMPGSVYNEAEGTLETMMTVNMYSAYHLTRALLPGMMKEKQGHIFNICSIASLKAYANGGAYSISKFALLGFSKNLREEMRNYGIKVTAVLPGAAYTDSWAGSGIDPKRLMEANDIAEMVFAASRLSASACVEEIVVRPQLGDL